MKNPGQSQRQRSVKLLRLFLDKKQNPLILYRLRSKKRRDRVIVLLLGLLPAIYVITLPEFGFGRMTGHLLLFLLAQIILFPFLGWRCWKDPRLDDLRLTPMRIHDVHFAAVYPAFVGCLLFVMPYFIAGVAGAAIRNAGSLLILPTAAFALLSTNLIVLLVCSFCFLRARGTFWAYLLMVGYMMGMLAVGTCVHGGIAAAVAAIGGEVTNKKILFGNLGFAIYLLGNAIIGWLMARELRDELHDNQLVVQEGETIF